MWTPDQLRQRTLQADRAKEDHATAQAAAWAEEMFQRSLKKFEQEAEIAASNGLREAISFEYEGDAKTFDAIPDKWRAVLERTRAHFEGKGFKTRVSGPFVSGKLNNPSTGCFDLYVQW